MIKQPVK